MFVRLITQTMLALSLIQFVPTDGATLERAAKLPTSPTRGDVIAAMQLASAESSLPPSDDRFPEKLDKESLGIVTTAQSVLVVDRTTGMPLYAKSPDAVRPIGSISKLMTALIFMETSPNLDGAASVLDEDYREGGRVYLAANDPVTVRDLLHASLVGSDNTATMSLVRLSQLSMADFLDRMNQKAAELNMQATHFEDPTGLSARNVSTASDIVKLLEAVQGQAEIASTIILPTVTITQASGRAVAIESTDDLLSTFINQPPFSMLGGKTGYLPEAGYCIGVGVRQEGSGDIFIILLGSETKFTRTQEVKGLASWAYRVFDWD